LASGLFVLGAVALLLVLPVSSSSAPQVSETITVQAGQTATGTMQLVPGVTYHAVVTGSIRVEYSGGSRYELHDALYCFETNFPAGASPGKCPAAGSNPAQVNVALRGFSGQGSAGCQSAGTCDVDLGAPGGKCCSSLPYASSHTYENDFEVTEPGKLKLAADVLCRPGDTSVKCVSGAFSVEISEKASEECGSARAGLSTTPGPGKPTKRFGPISVYGHVPGLAVIHRGHTWVIKGVKVAHLHDHWKLDDCGGIGEIRKVRTANVIAGGRPVATVGDEGFAPATAKGCPSDPIAARGRIVTGDSRIAIHGRVVAVPGSLVHAIDPVCGSPIGHVT
jgi:hypothetical protein